MRPGVRDRRRRAAGRGVSRTAAARRHAATSTTAGGASCTRRPGSTRRRARRRPDFSQGYVWPMYPGFDIVTAKADGSGIARLTDTPGYDAEATVVAGRQGDRVHLGARRRPRDLHDGHRRQEREAPDARSRATTAARSSRRTASASSIAARRFATRPAAREVQGAPGARPVCARQPRDLDDGPRTAPTRRR